MADRVQADDSPDDLVESFVELSNLLRRGGAIGESFDFTEDECEALYALGHAMYRQGRHSEAFKAFAALVMFDHMNDRYQMAFGAACQALGRYEDALRQYGAVGMMRLDDPTPAFHSAECMARLGHPAEAIEALELARELAGDKPQHEALVARITPMLQLLRQRLDTAESV